VTWGWGGLGCGVDRWGLVVAWGGRGWVGGGGWLGGVSFCCCGGAGAGWGGGRCSVLRLGWAPGVGFGSLWAGVILECLVGSLWCLWGSAAGGVDHGVGRGVAVGRVPCGVLSVCQVGWGVVRWGLVGGVLRSGLSSRGRWGGRVRWMAGPREGVVVVGGWWVWLVCYVVVVWFFCAEATVAARGPGEGGGLSLLRRVSPYRLVHGCSRSRMAGEGCWWRRPARVARVTGSWVERWPWGSGVGSGDGGRRDWARTRGVVWGGGGVWWRRCSGGEAVGLFPGWEL